MGTMTDDIGANVIKTGKVKDPHSNAGENPSRNPLSDNTNSYYCINFYPYKPYNQSITYNFIPSLIENNNEVIG